VFFGAFRRSNSIRTGTRLIVCVLAIAGAGLLAVSGRAYTSVQSPAPTSTSDAGVAIAARRDFVRTVRVSGTVAAVRSTLVSAPRLSGPNASSLVIVRLVRGGASVKRGSLLVEFDRQQQLSNAFDRRAEYLDLEEQIRRKRAEQAAARAKDETELTQAGNDAERARLETLKNEMLPAIEAEKNTQKLEEAQAKLAQLRDTFQLKRRAAEADLRILEIRRDRAKNATDHAQRNAERMAIVSPLDGMAVIKSIWKGNQIAEVQEGEEVRAGVPIVEVVDPAGMHVRAQVNQADINQLRAGQQASIRLDAYPDLVFDGRVEQVSPLGVVSTLNPKVRTFVALISIASSHARLMPDLTAAVDVAVERKSGAVIVPRDAIVQDGKAQYVLVRRGDSDDVDATFERRDVTIAAMCDHEAEIASGIREGAVVRRHATGQAP
jgi:HlyD family secretion protein